MQVIYSAFTQNLMVSFSLLRHKKNDFIFFLEKKSTPALRFSARNLFTLIFLVFIGIIFQVSDVQAQKGYVELKDGSFNIDGEPFYPISVNISFSYQVEGLDTTYSFGGSYCHFKCGTNEEAVQMVKDDLKMLQNQGFNSIRLDGLQVFKNSKGPGLMNLHKEPVPFPYYSHIQRIKKVVSVINEAAPGMKIILLTGDDEVDTVEDEYLTYVRRLAWQLKNETAVMAFDLINEPEYGGAKTKDKDEAVRISKKWYDGIKDVNSRMGVTYGLTLFDCVHSWDPNILALDFISYHLYQNATTRFRDTYNKLWWASQFSKKPFILGEIGLSAADSGSYTWAYRCEEIGSEETQYQFVLASLKMSKDCGCQGYQWWHHREVAWYEEKYGNPCHGSRGLSSNHYGLIYHKRSAKSGEFKKAWFAFSDFIKLDYQADSTKCLTEAPSLQALNKIKSSIQGRVLNQKGETIPFAWLSVSYYREDGTTRQELMVANDKGHFSLPAKNWKNISDITVIASGYYKKSEAPEKNKMGILMRYKPLDIVLKSVRI